MASLGEGTHTFEVRALDATGPDPTPASHTWRVDTTPPNKPVLSIGPGSAPVRQASGQPVQSPDPILFAAPFAFTAPFQTQNGLKVAWTASDPKGGEVATYQVNYYVLKPLSGIDWTSVVFWKETASSSGFFLATPGKSYCFAAHAIDTAGNVSASSSYACTSIPIRSKDLDHTAAWSKKTGDGHYFNNFSEATSGVLTLVWHRDAQLGDFINPAHGGILVKRAVLLATRCPSCGKVNVTLTTVWDNGTKAVTTSKMIDLKSATTKLKQTISLWTFAKPHWGELLTLNIAVASSGKPVRIEGVGFSPV
jgi:hypothetical protein